MTSEQSTAAPQRDRATSIAGPEAGVSRPVRGSGTGAEADTQRRRRRRRLVLIAAGAGIGATWWVGWHSPLTAVDEVVVDAPRGMTASSVRQAAGISAADHVLSVDAAAVRRAVMSALPGVAEVQVHRALPDTIRLEITPRTPLAAVRAGAGFHVVDADGVVFDRVRQAKGLPVIRADSGEDRQRARQLLVRLPDTLGEQVTRVVVRSRDDVTLGLRGDRTVRWGSVDDTELKARVLAGLVSVPATRYDVSAPLVPTTSGSPLATATP